MRLRRLLSVAAIAVLLVTASGCANDVPPVSDKVQQYYDSNKSLAPSAAQASPPVVMFIGDSYSAGTGATSEDVRWTTLLSASKGWNEKNVALGGTGYLATAGKNACGRDVCESYKDVAGKPAQIVPDLIFVSGGRNDGARLTPELQSAITETFTELRATYPTAKIVATNPIFGSDAPPPSHSQVVAAVDAAVTSNGGVMLGIGDPLLGHPELMTSDWVHPNDAGHKVLADAVSVAFDQSGIKLQP